eukprot:TRINITY_DN1216_c0_g1_i1.p1 TRINITY_DN1216_c0_g1~~TRINITY_DN1216_c0_g1_i1.p1  ORF type:complete len:76 (-),score=3.36 TRINITY_DN1216_c0_g1_i1:37-264(-)
MICCLPDRLSDHASQLVWCLQSARNIAKQRCEKSAREPEGTKNIAKRHHCTYVCLKNNVIPQKCQIYIKMCIFTT